MILLSTERMKPMPVRKGDCVNLSHVDSNGNKLSDNMIFNIEKDMILDDSCFFEIEENDFPNTKGFVGVLIDSKTKEFVVSLSIK